MKNNHRNESARTPVYGLLKQLQADAKEQKRRVRIRLFALRGDSIKTPSRGPILPVNNRPCIRWHFWKMAQAKQDHITQQITSLCSAMSMTVSERRPQ